MPTLTSPLTAPTGVGATTVTNPGSVNNLLPVITPAADATAPTAGLVPSAAADHQISPGPTATANAGNFVLVMPAATAEILGIVLLGIVITLVTRLTITNRLIARARTAGASAAPGAAATAGPAGVAKKKPSRIRRFKPSAVLHPRRRHGAASSAASTAAPSQPSSEQGK
jgi:hypothetical protein